MQGLPEPVRPAQSGQLDAHFAAVPRAVSKHSEAEAEAALGAVEMLTPEELSSLSRAPGHSYWRELFMGAYSQHEDYMFCWRSQKIYSQHVACDFCLKPLKAQMVEGRKVACNRYTESNEIGQITLALSTESTSMDDPAVVRGYEAKENCRAMFGLPKATRGWLDAPHRDLNATQDRLGFEAPPPVLRFPLLLADQKDVRVVDHDSAEVIVVNLVYSQLT